MGMFDNVIATGKGCTTLQPFFCSGEGCREFLYRFQTKGFEQTNDTFVLTTHGMFLMEGHGVRIPEFGCPPYKNGEKVMLTGGIDIYDNCPKCNTWNEWRLGFRAGECVYVARIDIHGETVRVYHGEPDLEGAFS